jgi:hypothetical protein
MGVTIAIRGTDRASPVLRRKLLERVAFGDHMNQIPPLPQASSAELLMQMRAGQAPGPTYRRI